jgi:hypothetical protein
MRNNALTDQSVISLAEGQLASKLNDEVVILNLNSGVYFGLNEVGVRVWDLAQQGSSFGVIRETILNEFQVEPAQCSQDLTDLLASMESEGLLRIE